MLNFSIGKQTKTEVTINWHHGDCPTQDEVRDALQLAKLDHLRPVLEFDPKIVGYPLGLSIMYQKYVRGGALSDEIFDMGVTAVYAWYVFDRYRVTHCASLSADYDCTFLYTTFDISGKYQNQSPGFAEKFPDIAAQEEREWEELRDKIEAWLDTAFREELGGYYSCRAIDSYTGDQREDMWPESVPISPFAYSAEEKEKCYQEFLEKNIEYERCNHRR